LERKSLKGKIINGFGDSLVVIQTGKMTEGSKCHTSKETAIHCFINSTKCAIFSSGIWPKPNARKCRLQTRWGSFPLLWLRGQQPTACRGLGGQMRPTAPLILGPSQPLPGGAGGPGVAPGGVLGGFAQGRVGRRTLGGGQWKSF